MEAARPTGTFVVVGGGIAGVTCAEQVRRRVLRPLWTLEARLWETAAGRLRGSLFRPLATPPRLRAGWDATQSSAGASRGPGGVESARLARNPKANQTPGGMVCKWAGGLGIWTGNPLTFQICITHEI